jgi:16S rRNA (cytidine1402-2'-O)-methyltransferase
VKNTDIIEYYPKTTSGLGKARLTMAATHIGNPEDIPPRSLEALRTAELLIFEEDRPARSFLKAAGVHREYERWSEHKQTNTLENAIEAFGEGKWVVYMSDQGTPNLADPGHELLRAAYRLGVKVDVIPGPSSITAALSACPFDTRRFEYLGFPPKEPDRRKDFFKEHLHSQKLLIVLDTPYRMKHVIEGCKEVFGANREGFLALDISGENERFIAAPFDELIRQTKNAAESKTTNFILIVDKAAEDISPRTFKKKKR